MKRIVRFSSFGILLMLAACQATPEQVLKTDDPRTLALVEQECAIYFAILGQMAEKGQTSSANFAEGCPANAVDIPVNIMPQNPPRPIKSRFGNIIYQRMIARGVPKEIADDVSKSTGFYDLVADSDNVYEKRS